MSRPGTGAKGAATRDTIVVRAVTLARQYGLDGLTIGLLADDVGMSKSGVFAHFGSREELQLAALDLNAAHFLERVLAPALDEPRGVKRLRALMLNWFDWLERDRRRRGGCLVAAAASEYDDQPGPIRDKLVQHQAWWREQLARAVRLGVETKELRADVDPQQLAFELSALALGLHHDGGLFDYAAAKPRAITALDRLIAGAGRRRT